MDLQVLASWGPEFEEVVGKTWENNGKDANFGGVSGSRKFKMLQHGPSALACQSFGASPCAEKEGLKGVLKKAPLSVGQSGLRKEKKSILDSVLF